jgi:hypothetical protein
MVKTINKLVTSISWCGIWHRDQFKSNRGFRMKNETSGRKINALINSDCFLNICFAKRKPGDSQGPKKKTIVGLLVFNPLWQVYEPSV